MALKPGDILRGKLRIDALIGRGGMGHVFAATDLDTRAQVAVKVVSRLLVDDVLMLRLHREAEAAQRIQSEFVPRVLEVSDTDEGETFLVMERLVGEPLSQRIREKGALPWSEVAQIGDDILRGVIDAHAAGIIHRDLKPSNVFLALKAGQVRAMVLDFGVCKMDGVDTERLTGTGESIGTVAYMAPEQIRGAARVDERADLFAFGVLVFEMLSGRLPHDGPSQMAILASKLENEAARLRDCSRVPLPEGLDAIITRALAREPAGRYGSAKELLTAWRELTKSESRLASASAQDLDATVEVPRAHDPPTEITRPDLGAHAEEGLPEHELPATGDAPTPASLSPEPHVTQTSLTTSEPVPHVEGAQLTQDDQAASRKGAFRLALMAGGSALLVAMVAIAIALSRPDPPSQAGRSLDAPVPAETVATPPAPLASERAVAGMTPAAATPSASTEEAADLELPADPSPTAKPRTRARTQPKASVAPTAPAKTGSSKITVQPRY